LATGSTVERKKKQLGKPAAVLCCFEVAVVSPDSSNENAASEVAPAVEWPQFSALEWIPDTAEPVRDTDLCWERVPDTPFIRPYRKADGKNTGGTLLRPLARQLIPAAPGKQGRPDPDQSYREWHRSKLLKIGHWQIGQRHGLIEIDHARTLQRAAESRSSGDFYGWLEQELTDRAQQISRPLLVYPAGRLGAIMIRYLLHKTERFSRDPKWRGRVVPINYLPDVGGGLRQISPLTIEHIKSLPGAYGGTAFFVDIGFVGNRTFRHTQRQLLAVGINKVVGIGLLNRTSFPALATEQGQPGEPVCYWRLDVPTMNDERSCPLCRGLVAMKEFRVRVETHHPSLAPTVERMMQDWKPNDPNLNWWDHGLEPITLKKPITKKFGFSRPPPVVALAAPTVENAAESAEQLSLFDRADDAAYPARDGDLWTSDEAIWHTVTIENSVQAAAYAIEIARTTAQPSYPWRFADALADQAKGEQGSTGILAAIDIAVGHLMLCCSVDMAVAERERGARALLSYLALCERVEPDRPQKVNGMLTAERLRRLRSLAAITLMNLDDTVKRLVFDDVASLLATVKLVNSETCCALMALVIAEPSRFRDRLQSKLDQDRHDQKRTELLEQNYRLVNLEGRPIEDQFDDALAYLGQADWHGYAKGELQTIINGVSNARVAQHLRASDSSELNSILPRLITLLHRTVSLVFEDRMLTDSGDFGALFKALLPCNSILPAKLMQNSRLIQGLDAGDIASKLEFAEDALRHMNDIRDGFHEAMLRIEDDSTNLSAAKRIENRLGLVEESLSAGGGDGLVCRVVCLSARRKLADGARYVLFGGELDSFVRDLLDEGRRHAARSPSCAPMHFDMVDERALAHVWVGIDFNDARQQRPRISLWNLGEAKADSEAFSQVTENMLRVHRKLGCELTRKVVPAPDGPSWFVTEITLRCIHGGSK
jgi:hypothetical protein